MRSADFLTDQKKRVDDNATKRQEEAKELAQWKMEFHSYQKALGHELLAELAKQLRVSEESIEKLKAKRCEYEVDGQCPE
eukprot:2298537-Amphidinium_carterae.1